MTWSTRAGIPIDGAMIGGDDQTPAMSGPVVDGLSEYCRRQVLLGRELA
ncbi:hypothetical protein G6020_13655 [Dietzia sp. B19]|nr:hypothetical protein [Dietzia sp. B19]MBB1058410.1 hypothetical protein [Dietzia sp. B19]